VYQATASKQVNTTPVADSESRPNQQSQLDLVTQLARLSFKYPAVVLTWIADQFSAVTTGITQAYELKTRTEKLESALAEKNRNLERMERLEREVLRLRQLLELPKPPKRKSIHADIIGSTPFDYRISLNVGRSKGVQPGNPVYNAQGLIGQVIESGTNECFVMLLTHPDFGVGGRIQRPESQEQGVVRGGGGELLTLTIFNKQADLKPGDLVTTSGISKVYPEGIPIGRVIEIRENKDLGVIEAEVVPSINLSKAREVVVLIK
jgi:rod shape-determining protein MreC